MTGNRIAHTEQLRITQGWVFGGVVRTPLAISTFYASVPGSESQLPAPGHSGRQQIMGNLH